MVISHQSCTCFLIFHKTNMCLKTKREFWYFLFVVMRISKALVNVKRCHYIVIGKSFFFSNQTVCVYCVFTQKTMLIDLFLGWCGRFRISSALKICPSSLKHSFQPSQTVLFLHWLCTILLYPTPPSFFLLDNSQLGEDRSAETAHWVSEEEAYLHHNAQGSSWRVAAVGPEPISFSPRTWPAAPTSL